MIIILLIAMILLSFVYAVWLRYEFYSVLTAQEYTWQRRMEKLQTAYEKQIVDLIQATTSTEGGE